MSQINQTTIDHLQNLIDSETSNLVSSLNLALDTVSTNGTDGVNTQQSNDMGSATNYARYQAMLDQYVKAGLNRDAIIRSLGVSGLENKDIFALLSQNNM